MMNHLSIALCFALFGVEIFDRFIVEQTVDRLCDGLGIQLVHFLAQFVAPVGDDGGVGDVADHHDQRRRNHAPAKFNLEICGDQNELKHRRCDVEQQEIEHDVDALCPAFDNLGHRTCPAVHMKTHRQVMQMAEHIFGQAAGGFLSDALKNNVAQIVEQDAAKTRTGISGHERNRDCDAVFHAGNHAVDGLAINPRHAQLNKLGHHHQQQRKYNACAQASLALWP